MSEKVIQYVSARLYDGDDRVYRLVGATSESGFFAYVESKVEHDQNAEWEQDWDFTQFQVRETDDPNYLLARNLMEDKHAWDFFSGQGLDIGERLLSLCCGDEINWLTCDECVESDESHDFTTCAKCGGDLED